MKKEATEPSVPQLPKRDPEFMRKIGSKGGNATKKKMGLNHFQKAGKKGGNATKKLWAGVKKERKAGQTG